MSRTPEQLARYAIYKKEWARKNFERISLAAVATDEREMTALCHYTNLQPLWASENLAKNDKVVQ